MLSNRQWHSRDARLAGMKESAGSLARELWRLFDAFRFAEALPLLAPDFLCEWPQTGERIRGPANFIAVQENYPGRWRCTVEQLLESGDEAVTRTLISDGKSHTYALSFFTVRGGRIHRLTEFWADPYQPPPGRERWVERG
jgi:ketosteroid isomerase-like protein